jgi:hypothetical protein
VVNKSNLKSKTPSVVTHTRDITFAVKTVSEHTHGIYFYGEERTLLSLLGLEASLLGHPARSSVAMAYNCSFRSPLVGCHGDRDVGLGIESCEHEILSQVLTGLAQARDVPYRRSIINLIY